MKIRKQFFTYYPIFITSIAVALGYLLYQTNIINYELESRVGTLKSDLKNYEGISQKPEPTTKSPENVPVCSQWIGIDSPVPQGEICYYDGEKDLQTFSDVQVWSYSDNAWFEPAGTGNPELKTILKPNNTEIGTYYPLMIKCPWGCTLGYTE